jgi:hypothetical protein
MIRARFASLLGVVGAVLVLSAHAAAPSTPLITGVDPAVPAPGTKPQTLTVTGREFLQGLTLTIADPAGNTAVFEDQAITKRTSSSFQVLVMLNQRGSHSLVVRNTDGGVSPPFAVEVEDRQQLPTPVLDTITPAEPTRRADAQKLLVEGRRFEPGLRAVVTDPMGMDVTEVRVARVTPNSFELFVRLEHAGEHALVITNPSGAVSNVLRFLVR